MPYETVRSPASSQKFDAVRSGVPSHLPDKLNIYGFVRRCALAHCNPL